jgi:hypothetical protein
MYLNVSRVVNSRYQSVGRGLWSGRRQVSPRYSAPVSELLSASCPRSVQRVGFQRVTSFFSTFRRPNPRTHSPVLTYLLSFDILANSFASTENSTLLFSCNSELFRKNTGGGVPLCSIRRPLNSVRTRIRDPQKAERQAMPLQKTDSKDTGVNP